MVSKASSNCQQKRNFEITSRDFGGTEHYQSSVLFNHPDIAILSVLDFAIPVSCNDPGS